MIFPLQCLNERVSEMPSVHSGSGQPGPEPGMDVAEVWRPCALGAQDNPIAARILSDDDHDTLNEQRAATTTSSPTMNPIALDSPAQTAAYLRTLPAIRERCGRVHALAQKGELEYFEYHPEKEQDAAAFCVNIIKVRTRRP